MSRDRPSRARAARRDPRWPALAAALGVLRERHRCAVRIVDADCGAGALLLEAARFARSLGFTGIEVRGISGSPMLTGRARAAAARLHEPAVGAEFDATDPVPALAVEADMPADIVLWHGGSAQDRLRAATDLLAAAGNVLIGDLGASEARCAA